MSRTRLEGPECTPGSRRRRRRGRLLLTHSTAVRVLDCRRRSRWPTEGAVAVHRVPTHGHQPARAAATPQVGGWCGSRPMPNLCKRPAAVCACKPRARQMTDLGLSSCAALVGKELLAVVTPAPAASPPPQPCPSTAFVPAMSLQAAATMPAWACSRASSLVCWKMRTKGCWT